jgi:hypothetical protein
MSKRPGHAGTLSAQDPARLDVVDAGRVVPLQLQHESLTDQALGESEYLNVEQGESTRSDCRVIDVATKLLVKQAWVVRGKRGNQQMFERARLLSQVSVEGNCVAQPRVDSPGDSRNERTDVGPKQTGIA